MLPHNLEKYLNYMQDNIYNYCLEKFKYFEPRFVVANHENLYEIQNAAPGDFILVEDEDMMYVKDVNGGFVKSMPTDNFEIFDARQATVVENNALKAENKRLKKQLKELRELIENLKKASPEPKNDIPQVNISMENINEKILEVKARTLCDSNLAKYYLERCNYDVEAAITAINWSQLNVPTEIL